MNEFQIKELQNKINYGFNDIDLLKKSMTHSSYANENPRENDTSNERLEFLGDSLLGMAVALLMYDTLPGHTEGQMTKLRATLVCERNLASLAFELGLGEYLLLGRGEENGGGRSRPSILSDAFEALIAAIYLDGGFEPVRQLISKYFIPRMIDPPSGSTDYKTQLQELIQKKPGQTLTYELTREQGPDHDKSFTVSVSLNGTVIGTGTGKSKKNAEQEAANAAVGSLADINKKQ